MSPGERAALGRRDAPRPHYAAAAPGFPPPYYPPYGVPPHPNAWLGAPLISMTGRTPPPRENTVSKLAMHAQGAPLIIQNRHDRRKYTTVPEQRNHRSAVPSENNARDRCDPENTRHRNQHQLQQQQTRPSRSGRNNNTDAVSVASDESSGSTNSETMLPRIIKPRKRRKKDRKPNNLVPHDLTSAALDLSDVDHCTNMGSSLHGIYEKSYSRDMALQYPLNLKVLDYPDPAPEAYRVAALGEAFEATRFGLAEAVSPSESAVSTCQCRYCDPVGQIWDVNSIAHLLDENSSVDFAPTKLEDSMKVVGPMGRRGTDTILRRSWSDPSARIPERKTNNNEAFSAPNLYSLFPPPRRTTSPEPRSPLALEISSEIVTSINGHRDLEIKLFSTSPPASTSERRSFFEDKSESAVNDRSANYELKSKSAVSSEKVSSENNVKKSVNLGSGCVKALGAGENSRNICDLALVSA
ncbi:uncharacterized protein LOC120626762 [Pararge aegeria]|uniref:Jg7001 protein n=2 Tax=Pararge aegeria TaxID=116150 RepID=A0A8S4SA50_9NEOP|nr:uncharacterized protein LOC120626762 [Pararge aegeria]CAH2261950.1 jg7001 [Pararge aegeria aegeria]